MDLLDDKGRIFGTVNVIDALAVLLVLAVVAAGTAFVLGTDDKATTTNEQQTTITFEITGVQPYVGDAITEGPVESDAIVAVRNKSVRPTEVVVRDQNGTLHERDHPRKRTVTLRVSLNTTTTAGGVRFEGKPLEVGRQLTLDLGPVTVQGNVTNRSDVN